MKVILQKDIANLGQKGDIKEVKDGYFRNFLMPQKMAQIATKSAIADWEKNREAREKERADMKGRAATEIAKLTDKPMAFVKKANEQGHLYDRVDKKEILERMREAGAKTIKEEWILLEEPLKQIGEFEIEIQIPLGEKGIVRVAITP